MLDILPRVPVRHFVVTLPEPWRQTLVRDPERLRSLRTAFMQELIATMEDAAAREIGDVHGGGVCAVHPCGSSLDVNVHLHALVLDGVYATTADGDATFHPHADEPEPRALQALARRLHDRLRAIAPRVRLPIAPRSGTPPRRVVVEQRLAVGPAVRGIHATTVRGASGQIVDARGLTLRAGPVVDANDRAAVARLAGYLTRPIPAAHAFTRGAGETIRYRLQRPFADGTTHVEFAPEELAARLRALGPAGASRITWHGVLAPHAAARRAVVPRQLELGLGSEPHANARKASRRRSRGSAPEHACPDCGAAMTIVALEVAA